MPDPDPSRRDDPVEAGALEVDHADVPGEERPPEHDGPVEGGDYPTRIRQPLRLP